MMTVEGGGSRQRPTLADLRLACGLLRAADGDGGLVVAAAIEAMLDGEDARSAFGLKGVAGRRSAAGIARREARNALIHQLARDYYPSGSVSEQARQIAAAAEAYWRRAAPLDRRLAALPLSYVGTSRELLFRLAHLTRDMPKHRTVRAILTAS